MAENDDILDPEKGGEGFVITPEEQEFMIVLAQALADEMRAQSEERVRVK